MRTSIEIPDELFRTFKVYAAERGITLRELLINGAKRQVETDKPSSDTWREFFGACAEHKEELDRVQTLIDEEFEPIDPEQWK